MRRRIWEWEAGEDRGTQKYFNSYALVLLFPTPYSPSGSPVAHGGNPQDRAGLTYSLLPTPYSHYLNSKHRE